MKIVWFSKHTPLDSQLTELQRLFGDYELLQDPNPFDSAQTVVNRFRKAEGDEMVVVAPLSVLSALLKTGIQPLKAVMKEVRPEEAEVKTNGRYYKFIEFQRVVKFEITTEQINEFVECC